MFVETSSDNESCLVCVTYKPPKASIEDYTDILTKSLDQIRNRNRKCYIIGDFNINLLNSESHNLTNNFLNQMLSYFMLSTIVKPTRVIESSATLIDNIFINTSSLLDNTRTGILYTDITDHFPVFYLQKSAKPIRKTRETFKTHVFII